MFGTTASPLKRSGTGLCPLVGLTVTSAGQRCADWPSAAGQPAAGHGPRGPPENIGHSPDGKKLGRRRTSAQRSDHSAMIVMTMLGTLAASR